MTNYVCHKHEPLTDALRDVLDAKIMTPLPRPLWCAHPFNSNTCHVSDGSQILQILIPPAGEVSPSIVTLMTQYEVNAP